MKMKWRLMGLLMLFLFGGVGLFAQQTNGGQESFEVTKAKAESGDVIAQYNLAICFDDGQMVSQDHTEAVKWYRRAAEQGLAQAQYNLAVSYAIGRGVKQDYKEVAKWIRMAAEQGLVGAQSKLGSLYDQGSGVPQDYVEAVKWYQKAADAGDKIAQCNLAVAYENGHGVTQDYSKAAKWYRKAADQGDAEAQLGLGNCFLNGRGVPQNDIEAYMWSSLATAQGKIKAAYNRDLVASRMSREEITEGQRRAAAFVPHEEITDPNSPNSISSNNPRFTGTGFLITDQGYLISNNHVVKDATKVRVITNAGTFDAKVIQTDAANDLALLKVEGRFAALPIMPSRKVSLGSTVATVGFPDPGLQGFSPKLAKGEIASLSGAEDDARYFQISVPVQPGNSGGALVDEHGNVVGIVAAKLNAAAALQSSGSLPENVNYAIKSSYLLSFLESVPGVQNKLKPPLTADRKFEDVVKSAQNAAVLVLVY